MGQMLNTVRDCFAENGWKYEQVEGRDVLRFGFSGTNANFRGFADAREDKEQLLVLFASPNSIPEDKRLTVAEFLTRANYGLMIGNFEMDMADGEVRYRVSVDVEGGHMGTTMVKNMVVAALLTFDRYYPGLMSVCFSSQTPSEAIDAARSEQ